VLRKQNTADWFQKPKWEPPVPTRVGKKKKRGPDAATRLPAVYPTTRCKLKMLKMERIKDYLLMEEEFVANQAAQSGEDRTAADRTRVDELRGTPMGVGSLEEIIDDDHAIVSSGNGPEYYVGIMSFVDKDLLEPGCSVLLHHKTHAIVGVLADDADPMVSVMKLDKAPTESYADIGGLESQIQEIKESVELPLTHPELYEEMGIRPPKGVILYGVPGTGKTLLAKAVANQTSATFLRIVGSELIQKYLGDGPKLVRELFRVAEEHAPSIVFIDEIDAVGTKRYDSTSGGEREIQRTMLELLNQLDGFDERGDVKVIMATNRVSTECAEWTARPQRVAPQARPESTTPSAPLTPDRIPRPRTHPPGPYRPQDRVPAPGHEDEAPHFQAAHVAHVARRRRRPRGAHHDQGRPVRCRHQGGVYRGGSARAARTPHARHQGRLHHRARKGAVQEGREHACRIVPLSV
jgi:26S proteasome regulatory subunit T2